MGAIASRCPKWLTYVLHLETLFFIGLIILIFYFVWFPAKGKSSVERLEDAVGTLLSVPKKLIKKKKPQGKRNLHESRCREIFQEIFGVKFKCVRPDWLANPITGRNLELDGFNPDVPTRLGKGLAFEYDGVQHSEYSQHFHPKGPMEFVYQTKKDSWKDMTCKEQKILLIRIPHFVAYQDLERYIKMKLSKEGLYALKKDEDDTPHEGDVWAAARKNIYD